MEKVISSAMLKAHKNGFLSVADLFALQKIRIEKSNRHVKTMGGKITYRPSAKNYSIVVYVKAIETWYNQGYKFNGIKPDSLQHAIDLVIEHEVGHIVTHYVGGKGHDSTFRSIVKKCYNHTDWRVR